MRVIARLEICTMQINILLYYCTLLLTCQILTLWVISVHCCFFAVCFVEHCFLPCVLCFCPHHYPNIRMITSWIPKFPNCIVSYTPYFA